MQQLQKLGFEPDSSLVDVEDLRHLIQNHDWTELAEALQFPTDRAQHIPTEAYSTWGLPTDIAEEIELKLLSHRPEFNLLFIKSELDSGKIRKLVKHQHRKHPVEVTLWLWFNPETERLRLILPESGRSSSSVRLLESQCWTENPSPEQLDRIQRLSLARFSGEDAEAPVSALRRHLRLAVDCSEITDSFFKAIRDNLDRMIEQMEEGPESEEARHAIALDTLLRLLFVYYLQSERLLDDDPRFLVRKLRETQRRSGDFYRDVLHPLFFDYLNTPSEQRSSSAPDLGDLPFLNGGLFEPSKYEQSHPNVTWDGSVWEELIEDLLEQHHFTTSGQRGDNSASGIDPEILGRVFEKLMYADQRKASGSFYTPKSLVERLVEETIIDHLADEKDISKTALKNALSGGTDEPLRGLRDALQDLRILDPAVGTGAFLVEAMHQLRDLYRASDLDSAFDSEAELRAAIIHRHLYGVDIQRNAVRICELRLWLAVFSSETDMRDELRPLPNLGHRIGHGDSLISDTAGGFSSPITEDNRKKLEKLSKLQDRYLETHGEQKYRIQRQMRQLRDEIFSANLESEITRCTKRLEALDTGQQDQTLFDEEKATPKLREHRQGLESRLEKLKACRDDRRTRAGFSFQLQFGLEPARGGFDIIITNPPWIRSRRVDKDYRSNLKEHYHCFEAGLWPEADDIDIQHHFGPQINLSSVFLERCVELLDSRGTMTALLPARTFRSMHSTEIRRLMGNQRVELIEDFSECGRDFFDADVYPGRVTVTKVTPKSEALDRTETLPLLEQESPDSAPPQDTDKAPESDSEPTNLTVSPDPTQIRLHHGSTTRRFHNTPGELLACGDDFGEPWLLTSGKVSNVLDIIRRHSVPLGSLNFLRPKKGIMTGRNRVFLGKEREFVAKFGRKLTTRWTRPVVTGRSISSKDVAIRKHIIWPYDQNLSIQSDLPDPLEEYFEKHREALEDRADYDPEKPIWQLYRLDKDLLAPKITWRDLSPHFRTVLAPSDAVLLNSTYYISTEDKQRSLLLKHILNSLPVETFASILAQRARGGWRRHFAWTVRMLPIPKCIVPVLSGEESAEDIHSAFSVKGAFNLAHSNLETLREWRHRNMQGGSQ